MRKQGLFGWLAALALLISLSVAACIRPITAAGVQTGEIADAQATTDAAMDAAMEEINKAAVYAADENRFNQHCSKVAYSGLDCQDNDGIQRLRRQK